MDSGSSKITHVSDTALMVAAARARESARADGLVRDPFAAQLAGDRGDAILEGTGRTAMLCFGVGMRSRFLDDLLLELIAEDRIDTVVLLGAGLDSRPWRLDLPAGLRWVEVEFPEVLEYKARILGGAAARCRVERVAADLSDTAGRTAAFAAAGPRTLVISEGLLMYLAPGSVEAIAREARRAAYWMIDLSSGYMSKRTGMTTCQSVNDVRDANAMDGEALLAVIHGAGWKQFRQRSYVRDSFAAAPERVMAAMQARAAAGGPPDEPAPADDPSGVLVFAGSPDASE